MKRLISVRGHHLWPDVLTSNAVVVDAGAHKGEFSRTLIERYGCRCVLVEANPELASALEVPQALMIVTAALTGSDGYGRFRLDANPESGAVVGRSGVHDSSGTLEVETLSLQSLMTRCAVSEIDLLKLDIEGSEAELIELTPPEVWSRVGQISCEFHDFLPRFAGARFFENARRRLEKLGFVCVVMSFRTYGDVLFINRQRYGLSAVDCRYLQIASRYVERLFPRHV